MQPETIVELTSQEIATAEEVGLRRHQNAMDRELRDRIRYQGGMKSEDRHKMGARAEYAVHKHTGLPWKDFRKKGFVRGQPGRECDVGPIEVRSKFPLVNGKPADLFVREGDWDWSPYLLVYEESRERYSLKGWRFGFEAKRDEFKEEDLPHPAFLVPPHRLWGLQSLKAWCASIGSPWKGQGDVTQKGGALAA